MKLGVASGPRAGREGCRYDLVAGLGGNLLGGVLGGAAGDLAVACDEQLSASA